MKPAHEPIVLARKPFTSTVAANVLQHGTGALNIDGCRVLVDGEERAPITGKGGLPARHNEHEARPAGVLAQPHELGRWPANLITSYPRDEYRLRDDVTPGQLEELAGWLRANS